MNWDNILYFLMVENDEKVSVLSGAFNTLILTDKKYFFWTDYIFVTYSNCNLSVTYIYHCLSAGRWVSQSLLEG